ncbi:ABC transporter ATP-binding protein [Paenibacillus sp. WQ 127069]|uniref:ABC transporter ATP-binding protein n=1 Tax=Paenibacillus baimaensis TaxID=2982185 RepID=A0ABT2UI62_9BACL|nr:ABC transporter ATP-binding protein [Paenibacillus sp. WQ 127069]MCU6793706.1 ABC transporter ATP-binding protein [Paenibacillus sp. WQ 127069]
MNSLLAITNLQVAFRTDREEVVPVDDISFSLNPGETLGIVGESGCGKSVTSLSIMRLLGGNGRITKGNIQFNGTDLVGLSEDRLRGIRGNDISMIFQEPMTSLNPVFTIGNQMIEGIKLHLRLSNKEAWVHASEMLKKVGIPRVSDIMDEYPHALSGGMRQRVMIAMALACKPILLIADEPTTALDVTIQAQILELMKKLREDLGTAIMLITHDLGIIAEMADKVIVMYAGQIVEEADVFKLFDAPMHPYTQGLMKSIPRLEYDAEERLASIPGTVPMLHRMPKGCRFYSRCSHATERCLLEQPPLLPVGPGHSARCWLIEEGGSI